MDKFRNRIPYLIFIIIISIAYVPGLTGPFLLDDYSSLPNLYENMDFHGWWYSIFTGGTGPTGRPIALLSFALQYPVKEYAFFFKLVNLLIHLGNAVLVCILVKKLLQKTHLIEEKFVFYFALTVALIWAILPIQVSTVLYVVQRMVLLSAFFTLLGIIGYVYSRDMLKKKESTKAYWYLCGSVASFGLLALFSKETGFLIVAYILVIELFINHYQPIRSRKYTIWKIVFLVLPLLAFVGYLLVNWNAVVLDNYATRTFTLTERLLTQPRVLWSYIAAIFFPKASSLSLFHDDYVISKSFTQPIATILAILAWFAVIIASIRLRKKTPLLLFAVAWFLAGHMMESTVIPLEIYFEHRNYLPSLSLVLLTIYVLWKLLSKLDKPITKNIYSVFGLGYLTMLFIITFSQSSLWGDINKFSFVQAHEHPHSLRARSLVVGVYFNSNMDKVIEEQNKMIRDFPNTPSLALRTMDITCADPTRPVTPLETYKDQLKSATYTTAIVATIDTIVSTKGLNKCQAVPDQYIIDVINTIINLPNFKSRKQLLATNLAILYSRNGKTKEASDTLLTVDKPAFGTNLFLAGLLATQKKFEEAMNVINTAEKQIKIGPKYFGQRKIIDELKKTIMEDMQTHTKLS